MLATMALFLVLASSGVTEFNLAGAHVPLGARVRFTSAAASRTEGVLTGAGRDSIRLALSGGTDTAMIARANLLEFEYYVPRDASRIASYTIGTVTMTLVLSLGLAGVTNGSAALGALFVGVPCGLLLGLAAGSIAARGGWEAIALERSWLGETPPPGKARARPKSGQ
jgi:hypothetical protein